MSGYLRFEPTGVKEIDLIQAALEDAGNAYHHTSQWSDTDDGEPSHLDIINATLMIAADEIKRLRAVLAAAKEK